MNDGLTVVLKLHRKYVGKGVTIGYLSVGDNYLCETLERSPMTLPPGIYDLEPTGVYYSMCWDVVGGVPDWYKKYNGKPKIRCMATDYKINNVEDVIPVNVGEIELGYLFGLLAGIKWWSRRFDEIMRTFILLTPKGMKTEHIKYQLQIL